MSSLYLSLSEITQSPGLVIKGVSRCRVPPADLLCRGSYLWQHVLAFPAPFPRFFPIFFGPWSSLILALEDILFFFLGALPSPSCRIGEYPKIALPNVSTLVGFFSAFLFSIRQLISARENYETALQLPGSMISFFLLVKAAQRAFTFYV